MMSYRSVVRLRATRNMVAGFARAAQTQRGSLINISMRFQSTEGAAPLAAKEKQTPLTRTERFEAGVKALNKPGTPFSTAKKEFQDLMSSGASTRQLLDAFITHLDSLDSLALTIFGREFVVPLMKRAVEEINKPGQTQIVPTPYDILSKSILYKAAPQQAFAYVAEQMIRDKEYADVLSLWVTYLEYVSVAQPHLVTRLTLRKLVTLAYIGSCKPSASVADPKALQALLQTDVPSEFHLRSEVRRLYPNVKDEASRELHSCIGLFYNKLKDPNSLQEITRATEAANKGLFTEVQKRLNKMYDISKASGLAISEDTLVAYMKMYVTLNKPQLALQLAKEIMGSTANQSVNFWNAMLLAASKYGRMDGRVAQAEGVLQKMPSRNAETDAILIGIYADAGKFDKVQEVSGDKYKTSPLIARAHIQAMCKRQPFEKVKKTVDELKEQGVSLDAVTYNSLLASAVRVRDHQFVQQILDEFKSNHITPDIATYTILMDYLLKSLKAQGKQPTPEIFDQFFDELREQKITPNEYTYTSIMDGLYKSGSFSAANFLFEYLKERRLASEVTYSSIFTSEFTYGHPDAAEKHFNEFVAKGFQLRPGHWAAVFEGFSRNKLPHKSLEYLDLVLKAGNIPHDLNKYALFYIVKTIVDTKDAELAKEFFRVVEKYELAGKFTERTLLLVKKILKADIEVPESVLARL